MKTINMKFFLEDSTIEIQKDGIKKISQFEIENFKILEENNTCLNIEVKKKNGLSFLSKILDFPAKGNIENHNSFDFFSSKFFKEAFLNNCFLNNMVNTIICVDMKKGYIMESLLSFPDDSLILEKYYEEMQKKAEQYFLE